MAPIFGDEVPKRQEPGNQACNRGIVVSSLEPPPSEECRACGNPDKPPAGNRVVCCECLPGNWTQGDCNATGGDPTCPSRVLWKSGVSGNADRCASLPIPPIQFCRRSPPARAAKRSARQIDGLVGTLAADRRSARCAGRTEPVLGNNPASPGRADSRRGWSFSPNHWLTLGVPISTILEPRQWQGTACRIGSVPVRFANYSIFDNSVAQNEPVGGGVVAGNSGTPNSP
jgi:hypothetical protein